MGSKINLYEGFIISSCCILLGAEFLGSALWYFRKTSQAPYEMFEKMLIVAIPLVVLTVVVALIIARVVTKKRDELAITLPEVGSLTEYLRASRTWILLLAVIIVMPIALLLTVWWALNFPESGGLSRRKPENMMVLALALGPILILIGLGGMIYTAIKRYVH